jgi:iron complex outermembrane receptor protein
MALVFIAALTPAPAGAQTALRDLTIEELMSLDAGMVFGASERLQPVTEAPASVTFITAQEIARFGYRSLADILHSVRGLYVTDDRNYSYIGIRGFGKPGDYNSRILLLINGHRVNDNIIGQAEIGTEFGLDPAMFDRVEIIRGPASSLYGDSAFFAVVNVITRSGGSLHGGSVTLEAGTLGTQLLRASAGRQLANGVDVAVSGTFTRSDGVRRLYFPAFDTAATNHGIAEGLDGEGIGQLYGRLTFKGLDVTGAYGSRQRDVPTASIGSVFNEQVWREETTDRHTLVDALYAQAIGDTRLTVRGSYDQLSYDATYPLAVGQDADPALVAQVDGLGTRWSAGAGLSRVFRGHQTLRTGVEFIANVNQNQRARFIGDAEPFLDSNRSSRQVAAYVQHEIKLSRAVIINGGLRYDRYPAFERVTPRAALIVLPSPTQSLKYLYGNAFRAPNESELNETYGGEQVRFLRPESIDTHEVVWERYASGHVRTAVSAYWYKADRLITPTFDDSTLAGVTYVNQGQVRAKGLEFEAQLRLRRETLTLVSYAIQDAVDQETDLALPNSPRHVVKARLSLPGPTPRSFVSVEGLYLSSRATLAGQRVSGAATLNVHVVQSIGRSWELFGGAQNLFDRKYFDPASSQHRQDAIERNGRTARIGLTWKFWRP